MTRRSKRGGVGGIFHLKVRIASILGKNLREARTIFGILRENDGFDPWKIPQVGGRKLLRGGGKCQI